MGQVEGTALRHYRTGMGGTRRHSDIEYCKIVSVPYVEMELRLRFTSYWDGTFTIDPTFYETPTLTQMPVVVLKN